MDEMEKYKRYLEALGIALVEMRAAEKLELCHALSDIFHNVPAKVSHQRPIEEIEQDLLQKAERHGMSNYLRKIIAFQTLSGSSNTE